MPMRRVRRSRIGRAPRLGNYARASTRLSRAAVDIRPMLFSMTGCGDVFAFTAAPGTGGHMTLAY